MRSGRPHKGRLGVKKWARFVLSNIGPRVGSQHVCAHTFGFGLPNKCCLLHVATNYVAGTALGSGDRVSAFNKLTDMQERQYQYSVSQPR